MLFAAEYYQQTDELFQIEMATANPSSSVFILVSSIQIIDI